MFGCVVAGRLLQTNLQQVDESHALFELPAASSINHISVFLLGTVPFPEGFGATVHFHWPGKGFQLLGMLSNEKPSAIFRLRGTFTANSSATQTAFSASPEAAPGGDVTAILGFSIEPLPQIQAQIVAMPGSAVTATSSSTVVKSGPDPTKLAERIVKNLFNYVSGFAPSGGGGSITPDSLVPMGIIAKWYEKFLSKVKAGGVGFLDNEE
ncbi:hypothetical protein HWV62_45498 [Athelia sp. TMB]|nr:hypothetical protein HWV62_8201 [Athelia sp. TMB]KAF7978568.1 hypothetical protein HWV62_45498 [Athelia sp. TMB]